MPVVVLPDEPLPPDLAATLTANAGEPLFRHPSGTPWIVGTADGRQVRHARNADLEVVLLGDDTDVDEVELSRLLGRARSVDQLDDVAARLAEGDVLFFARQHGRMRSQAPLFLTRSLCWTRAHGLDMISDEQLNLQRIAGLAPDPAVLAGRLTNAEISCRFGLKSIWRGLETIGVGEWLDSRAAHRPTPVPWWRPPRPDRSTAELAGRLRADLDAALRLRTAQHRTISADLSGGLDSTTLVYALAGLGHRPHTLFLASGNVANNDHLWAGRAADELGTTHHVVPYRAVFPLLLEAQTGSLATTPEGPSIASVSAASVPLIEGILAGTGSTRHLNGHAGDALFGPVSTMLWSLLHSRAPGRVRQVWRHRLANRYPIGATARMVLRAGSYRGDLRRVARSEFHRRDDDVAAHSRWIQLPQVHPALTGTARQHLRELAAESIGRHPRPYAADRTTHQIVQYLAVHGTDVRRMNQARTPGAGLAFDSPYLDRRIVETALALRIGDRVRQYPAKPLLAAARPDAMPMDFFTRRDKGDYTAETFEQHRAVTPLLRELFADGSALEDLGLISAERVLRSVNEYSTDGTALRDLDQLAFAERWLRSVPASVPDPARG